jgi:alkylhydroperoxidase/carboxymuconolactone decarboxylase family protein
MPSYYVSEDLPRFAEVGKGSPKLFDGFNKWYTEALASGALDAKTKKLIAFAVAHAIHCAYSIDTFAAAGAKEGLTPEQMTEAAHVAAAICAGSSLAHNVQAVNTWNRDE